ncbi:putative HAD superfamily protein [Paenibacillus cellulosilyticus]|uniref:Nucleotidase n=1 Tax=Paenibacillus cellulosilyticus TaxID=375489 RepID=A0A2V2YVL8_9BACL|nr:hypothetical protein [Paenibacillus cellulosilyticus]PWW05188.1 putative HAD superfamily protein [Paenibacillus cellulosilyticus]QKS43513.1 hypothetical protein HUB94_03000 [Paenibacillus cellulosilyticus]
MHIGIDLDNTVLDATTPHLHYYNIASGLTLTADDVDNFYLYKMYGWNKEEREAIYHLYGRDIHWHSNPLPHAVEVLQQLYRQHRLSIITARPLLFRDVTLEWLAQHGIAYHDIAFVEDKLQQCADSKVDVLIDDGPHYAEQFVQVGRPVILMEQPYNLSVPSHDLLFRATGWADVQKHLTAIAER